MPRSKINKAEFIRKHPSVPASEVVAKAKAVGIKLTPNYVYMVRGASNSKKRSRGAAAGSRGGGLTSTIDRLARVFAAEIVRAIRAASIQDLRSL